MTPDVLRTQSQQERKREDQPETESTRSAEAFWRPHAVSPSEGQARSGRATDAARISFSLQLMINIVSVAVAATAAVWAASGGQSRKIDALDAKFQIVVEKIASQQELRAQEAKLNEERLSNMRETIRKMEARIEMIQIQSAARDKEINDSLMLLKSRR